MNGGSNISYQPKNTEGSFRKVKKAKADVSKRSIGFSLPIYAQ